MNNISNILKIIFILLILITVGEGMYYLYVLYNNKPNPVASEQSTNNLLITPSREIPTLIPVNFQTANPDLKLSEKEMSDRLDVFRKLLRDGVIKSSVRTTVFESTIKTIDTRETLEKGIKYKLKITIKAGDTDVQDFNFSEYELERMKVFEMKDGKEQSINYSQLKSGDKIRMETTIDLTKEWAESTVNIKITKI